MTRLITSLYAALSAVFLLGLLAGPRVAAAQADLVVHNATIYTMTSAQPTAEAMAIQGERILMVGTTDQVRSAYPNASTMDAEGRAIVPGLIDAHGHLMGLAETFLQADVVGTESVGEVIERLEAFAEDLPE